MKANPKQIKKAFGVPKFISREIASFMDDNIHQFDENILAVQMPSSSEVSIGFLSDKDYVKSALSTYESLSMVVFIRQGEDYVSNTFCNTNMLFLGNEFSHYTYAHHWTNKDFVDSAHSELRHHRSYIGKTSQGFHNRLKQHIYGIQTGSSKVYRVARELGLYPTMSIILGAFKSESEALDYEETWIDNQMNSNPDELLNVMKNRYAWQEFVNVFGKNPKSTEMCEEQFAEEYNKQDRIMGFEQRMAIADRDRDFTDQEVKSIRLLLAMGEPPRVIADKMNVRHERVNDIINDRTYRKKGLIS